MTEKEKPFVTVGSVVHALNILRLLAREPAPLGVTAIARALDISPSSCFNLLKTLCAEGVVDFDTTGKHYRLGAAVSAFAMEAPAGLPAGEVGPRLAAMAAQYHLASGLWRMSAGRLVLMDFADSDLATRVHMTIGQRLPMLIGAMGRCVAAHASLSPAQLAQAFGELRWARAPGLERYRKEVALARRRGWSLDDGDFMRGLSTVAAPVLDAAGAVRYCIANTFFQGEHDAQGLERVGNATAHCAQGLSGLLQTAYSRQTTA